MHPQSLEMLEKKIHAIHSINIKRNATINVIISDI